MTSRLPDVEPAPWTAAVATAGALAIVATDVIGSLLVSGYDPVRDSISDLAAGPLSWIQDAGLLAFAGGITALAFGLWRIGSGRLWLAGSVALVLLALDVLVIAVHDAYGDREPGGLVFHVELVYVLGALFGAATLALAPGMFVRGRRWGAFDLAIAVSWIVLAPVFFFLPTRIDGLYERGLALLVVVWVLGMARLLATHRRRVGPR